MAGEFERTREMTLQCEPGATKWVGMAPAGLGAAAPQVHGTAEQVQHSKAASTGSSLSPSGTSFKRTAICSDKRAVETQVSVHRALAKKHNL